MNISAHECKVTKCPLFLGTVQVLGDLSLARAVPRNVPEFNCGFRKTQREIDIAAVILVACRLMQYHRQPQYVF